MQDMHKARYEGKELPSPLWVFHSPNSMFANPETLQYSVFLCVIEASLLIDHW